MSRRWVSLSEGIAKREGRGEWLISAHPSGLGFNAISSGDLPWPLLGQVPLGCSSPPSTSPFIMHNTIAAMSYLMVSSLHWMWDPSTRVGAGSVLITSSLQTLNRDLACSWQAIPQGWMSKWMNGAPRRQNLSGTRFLQTLPRYCPFLALPPAPPAYFLFLS